MMLSAGKPLWFFKPGKEPDWLPKTIFDEPSSDVIAVKANASPSDKISQESVAPQAQGPIEATSDSNQSDEKTDKNPQ